MWGWPVCLIQKAMTAPRPVSTGLRALGWDVRTGYSTSRGERLSDRAFGHGGFTGTVLWIDPGLDLFFVFLSNRVHPDGKGAVNPLAGRIATIAAAAIDDRAGAASPGKPGNPAPATSRVLTGLDVLQRNRFVQLEGPRGGLLRSSPNIPSAFWRNAP